MIPADRIATALKANLPDAKLLNAWPLDGGISAQMTAFEIQTAQTTQKLIARQPCNYKFNKDPDAAKHEFLLLQKLHEKGLPVQKPIFVEDNTVKPFFVVEYVEGVPNLNPINKEDYIRQHAETLVRIHQTKFDDLDDNLLEVQTRGYGNRPEKPNDRLRETEIRDTLESVSPRIQSNPKILRHGDYWPGNVLWQGDKLSAVIDWEECRIGEALSDLAIARLDVLWVLDLDAMHHFTEVYQAKMNLNLGDLPYWDLCASLRPIQVMDHFVTAYPKLGRPDITVQTLERDHQLFVGQALANFH